MRNLFVSAISQFIKECVPALHISLGIFLRLFQLYEQACHELDVKLAASHSTSGSTNDKFNNYAAALQKISDMEDTITQYRDMAENNEQLATWFAMDDDINVQEQVKALLLEAQQLRNAADGLVSTYMHANNGRSDICKPELYLITFFTDIILSYYVNQIHSDYITCM